MTSNTADSCSRTTGTEVSEKQVLSIPHAALLSDAQALAVPACEALASTVFDTATTDVAAMAFADDAAAYTAAVSEAAVSLEAAAEVSEAAVSPEVAAAASEAAVSLEVAAEVSVAAAAPAA